MERQIINLTVAGLFAIAMLGGCSKQDKLDFTVRDKHVAQQINCFNNLQRIGLAFRVWNGDHNGQFPFNVSTNAGGTMELGAPDKDGFDSNAWLHLKMMSKDGELNTPLLLICPQDRSKSRAAHWESLTAENITYRFRSGTNINLSSPHEILAVCPIDGNILYADGTVVESKQSIENNPDGQHRMRLK